MVSLTAQSFLPTSAPKQRRESEEAEDGFSESKKKKKNLKTLTVEEIKSEI